MYVSICVYCSTLLWQIPFVGCENRYYSFRCECVHEIIRLSSVSLLCVFECVYARSARSQLRVGVCVRTLSLWTRKMTKTKIIKNYFPQFSNRCASEHNHLYCSLKTILYLFRWYWLWLGVFSVRSGGWMCGAASFIYLWHFLSREARCARASDLEQSKK